MTINKAISYFRISLHFLLILALLVACSETKQAPPLPLFENEHEQPVTKSFSFSERDTIQWITKTASQIKKLTTVKFDWDKLPSKPFNIEIPYSLKEPLTVSPLVWDSIERTDFDLEALPEGKLHVKITVLGDPKIVKAGYATSLDGASRGVMSFDSNFGLPGQAWCSLKDKNGMIWFGSSGGIVRYDSENLYIYGLDQGLNIGNVYSIYEDSQGRIWAAGNTGTLSMIDLNTKLVYEMSNSLKKGDVYDISEDSMGRIWYACNGVGYNILDFDRRTIRQFSEEEGLADGFAIKTFEDDNGLIWLGTGQGAHILDLKNKTSLLLKKNGLLNDFITNFFQDKEGKMWIGTGGGYNIINKKKTTISTLSVPQGIDGIGAGSVIFQDKKGKFWLGTNNGLLFSYMESTNTLEKYIIVDAQSNFVFNVFEDDQDQLWATIAQGGLYKIDPNGGRPANYDTSDGLANGDMWATLEASDGNIWIGSRGGIDIYDPITQTIKHLGEEQGLVDDRMTRLMEDSKGRIWSSGNTVGISIIDPNTGTIQHLTADQGLESEVVRAAFEDDNGLFWLGGSTGELYTYDFEKSILKSMVIDTTVTQVANNIMVSDTENNIWVGTLDRGIHIYDPKNNTRVKLTSENGLVSDRVYSMTTDKSGNIWVATHLGVELINTDLKELTTFTTSEGLGANDVYAVLENENKILTGTSNGLSVLTPYKKSNSEDPFWRVQTHGMNQGLNLVDFAENSFTIDKNGRFWASLVQTLTLMDVVVEDTTAYKPYITGINILDRRQFFEDVAMVTENTDKIDSLWVREKKGFYLKNKSEIDSSYSALNNIRWKTVEGPFDLPVGLELPHTQNYLSFNYSGAQFRNPDKLVYRYILEGIDKNWSAVSNLTLSENYRDLPPGSYNFKVASKGFDGVWSRPVEFKFSILPPWWKTWWAYTIFVVLFLGLGLVILHYRSKWLKKENRILEERVVERTAELKETIDELENTQSQLIQSEKMASLGELTAGIAHEIQNPMNFINNFAEVSNELVDEMCEELDKGDFDEAKTISKDIVQNLEKISHHGKRASSIVKGMLEHSRNSSGQRELIDINVLSDEYLRLAYHGLRAKDKSFNADFKTDFDDSLDKIEIIPQDLGRVILNLINNAFYAVTSIPMEDRDENYKPLVTVTTKKLKDQVLISIKDNGPGIPKEIKDKIFQPFFTTKPTGKGTGLGLSLAYDIVTTGHGGAIELNTAPGKGTEFSIYIPIKKN